MIGIIKKMKYFIFIAISLILNNYAYSNCDVKDLSDPNYLRSVGKENLIEHFKTPRHQDSVGWCGAYASADSLSFAVGEPVSALDVSINQYANSMSRSSDLRTLNGITPNAASNVALKNGYCPESIIPSNQTSSSNLGHYALTKLMEAFQSLSDKFKARGKSRENCVTCGSSEFEDVIKPSLPGVTVKMVQDVLIKQDGDSLASLRELMNQLCTNNRKRPDISVKTYIKRNTSKSMSAIINEALENNAMPSIGMKASRISSTVSEDHELIIIGRRPGRNGTCEYEIRNSWGRGCHNYNDVPVECNANKGSFWLRESDINAGVDDIVVIQSKGATNSVSHNSTKLPSLNLNRDTNRDTNNDTHEERPIINNDSNRTNRNFSNNSNTDNTRIVPPQNIGNSNSVVTNDGASNSVTNNQVTNNQVNDTSNGENSGGGIGDFFSSLFSGIGSMISSLWQFLASFFKY